MYSVLSAQGSNARERRRREIEKRRTSCAKSPFSDKLITMVIAAGHGTVATNVRPKARDGGIYRTSVILAKSEGKIHSRSERGTSSLSFPIPGLVSEGDCWVWWLRVVPSSLGLPPPTQPGSQCGKASASIPTIWGMMCGAITVVTWFPL